jgi:hypothetical protein
MSYFSQPLSNASFVGPARVERRPKVYQSAVGIFGLAKATLLTNFTVDDARNWGNHPMVFIYVYFILSPVQDLFLAHKRILRNVAYRRVNKDFPCHFW